MSSNALSSQMSISTLQAMFYLWYA